MYMDVKKVRKTGNTFGNILAYIFLAALFVCFISLLLAGTWWALKSIWQYV